MPKSLNRSHKPYSPRNGQFSEDVCCASGAMLRATAEEARLALGFRVRGFHVALHSIFAGFPSAIGPQEAKDMRSQ